LTSEGQVAEAVRVLPRLADGPAWRSTLRRFFKDPKAVLGAVLLSGFLLFAVGAPVIAPEGSNELHPTLGLETPTLAHPMGTDRVGRDILSRVIYGTRTSVSVGLIAVAVACAIGVPLGLISGFFGGWVDEIAMRFVDAWISFPSLLLTMGLIAILGPGVTRVMLAVGLGAFPLFARLIRSRTLAVKHEEYVLAARCIGASHARIIRSHVLPNTIQPVIVQASLLCGFAVLAEAGLSFLGIGIKPPEPTWGVIIQEGFPVLRQNPWVVIWPGVCITIFVLAVNLLGDRLRDVLDPRLRGVR